MPRSLFLLNPKRCIMNKTVCGHGLFSRLAWACLIAGAIHSGSPTDAQDANVGKNAAGGGNESAAGGGNMVTEFKGTLKGFQRGVITVTREDGTDVMVQPPEDPSAFVFIAQAKPAFLGRGMMVRFSGTFDRAGNAQSAIEKVEIFQPVMGRMNGRTRENFTPGVHTGRRGGNEAPPAVATVKVVGGLVAMDASGIMVQAGTVPVRAPLSPEAKLEIRFNNLNLAQEGDAVSVAGFYQPPDDTKVKADTVTITTERVYGEPVEPKTRRTTRSRRKTDASKEDPKSDNLGSGQRDLSPDASQN